MIGVKNEFGDYQTPVEFCNLVCNKLIDIYDIKPDLILEPTCGKGNFLLNTSNIFMPEKQYGVEINKEYYNSISKQSLPNTEIYNENIFDFNLKELVVSNNKSSEWLAIGNPPWVNNSDLSSFDSENVPKKTNFKKLKGFDAMTGSANFDICEYIILQLIDAFASSDATIAMLCKTLVARNIFRELVRTNVKCNSVAMYNIDAKEIFGVSADSCLLVIQFKKENNNVKKQCSVFDINYPNQKITDIGYVNNKFYSDINLDIPNIEGKSPLIWRQGVKHDCARVMELDYNGTTYINKLDDEVILEKKYIYPLLKSSHLKKAIIKEMHKFVIITQRKVGESTSYLETYAPHIWSYLTKYDNLLSARKSSIYKNSPKYSIFGIGDYSFSPYKVAISGFYKKPLFSLVYSDKPVMLDDTCYFLSFDEYDLAYVAMLILNSDIVQKFLLSISFIDSKRPYTKKVLERIDFKKSLDQIVLNDLHETEKKLNTQHYATREHLYSFAQYIDSFDNNSQQLFFSYG